MNILINYIYLLCLVSLMVLAGFFSGLETAFICTDRLKAGRLKKSRQKNYRNLQKDLSNPEHFLAVTLTGTNVSVVMSSVLFTLILMNAGVKDTAFWVSFILTPVLLIFSELIPKQIGRALRFKFVVSSYRTYRLLEIILKPLAFSLGVFPLKTVRFIFGKEKQDFSKDDIRILTEALHSEGGIDRVEKEAIDDIFGLSKKRVKDICTNLNQVIGVDYVDKKDAILKTAGRYGYTRYPVFRNKQAIGYLNLFDLFYKKADSWQKVIRAIPKVSINQRIDDVLVLLRNRKENMALVLKGGDPFGIVTLQDLMREVTESLAG